MKALKKLAIALFAAVVSCFGTGVHAQSGGMRLYVFTSGSLGGFPKAALQIGGQGNIDWAPVDRKSTRLNSSHSSPSRMPSSA